MPSRGDKERKLRHNVEVSTEREYRAELKKRGVSHDPKLKHAIRKENEKAARQIDRTQLHEVWND
jgi:hypothetical protein